MSVFDLINSELRPIPLKLVSGPSQIDQTFGGQPEKVTIEGLSDVIKNKAQIAALTNVTAANATAAAGATPTKAEFDVVVALANANKAAINAIIAALKA